MSLSRLGASTLARMLSLGLAHEGEASRLQHVLEQFPAAAFIVATGAGTFLAANARAAALTEWTRVELAQRALAEVFSAPRAREVLQLFYVIELGTSRQEINVPLRTRSGRLVYVDLRLSAFDEDHQRLVFAAAIPVKERLAPERETARSIQALRAIEDLLRLFNTSSDAALEQAVRLTREMTGADAAGYYRFLSEPGLQLQFSDGTPAGFPQQIGPTETQSLTTPLQWAAGQRPETALQLAAQSAGWAHFLTHPVGAEGASVGLLFVGYRGGNAPTSQAGALLGLAARLSDHLVSLTHRDNRLAEAQSLARRLSARLAAVNTQIDEGVILLGANGTIEELNRAAARLLGYRSADVTGLPFSDVLIGERKLMEAVRRGAGGAVVDGLEGQLHHRGGEAFPVRLQLRPLPEGGAVLSLRDLSEARASQKRQEHLNHLADAAEFTQSFAHEIRNPLNAISVGVQYLAGRLTSDNPLLPDLVKIQAEAQRVSDLMNAMLAFNKPADPKFQAVGLEALLRRLLGRYAGKMQRGGVHLSFSAEDCSPVWVDPQLIERVFLNLFDNALQAMAAGGHLSLRLRTVPGASGCMVETQVCDTGPGIPPEMLSRVFTPYFTTKADGTGLGLAISKRLISLNRGAIDCTSFPVGGTIFTVTLPAHTPCQEELQD